MSNLYVNMRKLDYWSLKLALDTVVTYKMMNESHKTLDTYQNHESGYHEAVSELLQNHIRADKEFLDVVAYQEYPTFDDGTPVLPRDHEITDWLNWGKSRIRE